MHRATRLKIISAKYSRRRNHILGLLILYLLGTVIVRQFYNSQARTEETNYELDDGGKRITRKLLSTSDDGNGTEENNSTQPKCTRPSIEEFPRDVFTMKQRSYGAVLLHIFCAVYMFMALAFICDDYFISALDKICEHFSLSEDVAGATFMAAGSSAPELFTAIIGVFIAKGDVGLGTIVGSAVFNILVIIALCALFAGQIIHLSWWPLFRDSLYYIVSIAALILTLYDGTVRWYESMIMIFLYFGYILLMKFNPMIVKRINRRQQMRQAVAERVAIVESDSLRDRADVEQVSVKYVGDSIGDEQDIGVLEMGERTRLTWKELGLMIMLTDKFPPTTRFRAACLMVIHREDRRKMLLKKGGDGPNADDREEILGASSPDSANTEHSHEGTEVSTPDTPFMFPHGSPFRGIFWIMTLPIVILLYFTIPDCRKPKWEHWWPATFFVSIFWIMVSSYVMVWMVCVIGFTLGVPDVIMGITFLAAGTSIPDAISSLLVAREGMGDMAVSNSIGSNIFDILIGLAVPWFIKSAIINPGMGVEINSRGMVYSVALLFVSVLLTVFTIYCNKWRLDRKLGIFFTFLYLVFVTISACIEFNLFVFVNFPICAYDG